MTRTKTATAPTQPTDATTNATNTALATTSSTATAIAPYDEFADMAFAGDDGLGELDAEDKRVSSLAINSKRIGSDGRQVPADEWFDDLNETSRREANVTFLLLHKTNAYTVFDQTDQKTHTVCLSEDRITGKMSDGTRRPCKDCPDAQWREGNDGKRTKPCSAVFHLFGVDNDTHEVFVSRFRRTSLPIIQQHLRKHHINRLKTAKGRTNVPLYAFPVRLSAAMNKPKPTHALPIIERVANPDRGGPSDPPFIRHTAEFIANAEASVAALQEQLGHILRRVDERVAASGVSDADDATGGDTSFDTSTYTAGEGQDFVDEASA